MSHGFLARSRICGVALASAGALLLALTGTASAATYNVGNATQLEEAITAANADCAPNTIVLGGGVYLPSRPLTFTNTCGPQTVEGPAHPPEAVIDGGNEEVEHPELVTIEEGASVLFKDVVVDHGGGGATPAFEDFGTLDLEASTVAGNHGTGILVEPGGVANASNSTLSDGQSAGLVNVGTASLFNVTVAYNKTNGIENAGTLNLHNTIVAENGSPQCVGAAPAISDHVLSSDSSCGAEITDANPDLSSLFNNGGGGGAGTELRSLQTGSPAIDAGNPETCTSTDQEGEPRPDVPDTPCDIGADEWNGTAPTITAPSEVTKEATGASGAVVTYSATATSAVASVRSFSCSSKSGSTFPIGETIVTCTAKDGHGNVATASIKVIVTDKTPPVISGVPSTIEKEATGPSGAEVTYTTPTATDIVDGTVPVICTPASGSTFAIGETTVNCTATDKHGNTAEATFKVIVTDKTPPVISGVPSTIEKVATSPSGAEVTYTNPAATDIVDGTVPVICTPASGSTFAIGETTVKCTATDKHGNTAEATFKVIVTAAQVQFKEWILKGSLSDHRLGHDALLASGGLEVQRSGDIPRRTRRQYVGAGVQRDDEDPRDPVYDRRLHVH